MFDYKGAAQTIIGEIVEVFSLVSTEEVERLVDDILRAEKVFVFGTGRSLMHLQPLGNRLAQMDIDCQAVGAMNQKPIGPRDLLILASGSGETRLTAETARIARDAGARVALITSPEDSTIMRLSDIAVHLPCPTKNDALAGVLSAQPMGSLFEQCLLILGDVVTMAIRERKGLSHKDLRRHHANLE